MGLLKKYLSDLFTFIVNISNHAKCASLSNQKYSIQLTLINLHPNEYSQGLCHYSFAVNFDRYVGSYSALNDLSNRLCISNKTEDLT